MGQILKAAQKRTTHRSNPFPTDGSPFIITIIYKYILLANGINSAIWSNKRGHPINNQLPWTHYMHPSVNYVSFGKRSIRWWNCDLRHALPIPMHQSILQRLRSASSNNLISFFSAACVRLALYIIYIWRFISYISLSEVTCNWKAKGHTLAAESCS